jgi:hypothetical protein
LFLLIESTQISSYVPGNGAGHRGDFWCAFFI